MRVRRQDPEVRQRIREYRKEYNQRPDVKKRNAVRELERYHTPDGRAHSKAYRSRPEVKQRHAEREKVRQKKLRRENPEYAERRRKYEREYWAKPENRARQIARYKKKKEENPEWVERERLRARLRVMPRRKPWDETVTAESIAAMLEAQRGRCVECRTNIRSGYHLDHILPLARGGESTLSNLQLLCADCNLHKGAKDPFEFAALKGRLL